MRALAGLKSYKNSFFILSCDTNWASHQKKAFTKEDCIVQVAWMCQIITFILAAGCTMSRSFRLEMVDGVFVDHE
jgi:hypothetical protein